jgi:nicotinate-nucleotide adenylyltransferase
MNIAIYGGSFDPPHLGHYQVVVEAIDRLPVDKVIVLPNYRNPWKETFQLPPEKRYNLLQKIFNKFSNVEVSDFEINNGRPTLTIETVRHFSEIYDSIYLLIGADNLKKVHLWDEFEEIDKRVTWVVATRNEIEIPDGYIILPVDVSISSTQLRENFQIEMVPEEIRDQFS